MPNQQKKVLRKNFSPSSTDFLGTDDPVQQRQEILTFAALQNAQLSAAYINAGGSWSEWDATAGKSCDINRKTTEVFTRAVNGDADAIHQIATDLDMPEEGVKNLLAIGPQSVNVGEQTYSETLTMRDVIGAVSAGTGLYNEGL